MRSRQPKEGEARNGRSRPLARSDSVGGSDTDGLSKIGHDFDKLRCINFSLSDRMELILDKRNTGGRRKNRLQERFDRLRSELERERRRDVRFRQDLDELVEIYHRRSIQNDQVVFDDLVALSDKLITFAGRKSLSDWHRIELDEWLRDLIERRIAQVDPEVSERLRSDYREAISRSMGLSVDELVERFEADYEDFEQAFDERIGAEDAEDGEGDPWQEDLFGFDDFDPETESFDTGSDANGPDWLYDEEEDDIGRSVMDGSWAKDLFRRAAQALHPDREPDPERRQVKQERMRELLKARKHGDIMAMLTIYSDSVSGADIVLAEQEMTEICDALEHQLEALELERHEHIYSHPVRHMVFELLYHSTKKGRQRRIQEWEQDLKHELAGLRDLVAFLRNLNRLKSVLRDRRDERAAVLAEVLFDDIRF